MITESSSNIIPLDQGRIVDFGPDPTWDEHQRANGSTAWDTPPPRRFTLVPFSEIRWSATSEYLVKDVLPVVGLVLVYGPPKCGKSFWAFDLSMHIARGISYRGKRVRQGEVVYLAAEGGSGFKKRVEAYKLKNNNPDARFHLLTMRPDLAADTPALIADIRAQLGTQRPAVIFVDTVNRTLVGSENKPDDMARYLRAAASIEDEFGCCVALIHHCGVEVGRPRGHTSLTAAADVQIRVERDAAENVVAEIELSKDGPSGEQFVSELDVIEIGLDENGDNATSCVVVPVDDTSVKKPEKTTRPWPAQTELARRALAEVIVDHGVPNNNIPAGLKGVQENAWREECYRRGIGGPEKEAMRKAFNRAKDKLAVYGATGQRDGIVWLARAS